ncbi:hypothetical protein BofuT4_P111970.1 [Botrytis cinerea T4]|uniref:Uncharacterized protein n=1 Tax=Botryotinia fuckeliana (strain T4) TaxID=999810 RepID=G2Y6D2_BOTF4|nr:hypothetical protein BofuT4_P111970.1 [Botrytis cinerea T4]
MSSIVAQPNWYLGNFGFLPFVLELHSLIQQGTEFET